MVVIGAAISLLSALLVLAVATKSGLLDWARLVGQPKSYIAEEPFRVFGPLFVALVLSYAAAWLRDQGIHGGAEPVVHPGMTMWQCTLWLDRPSGEHSTIATVGLRDGRVLTGMVRGFNGAGRRAP
jgi:hypothetical protein